MEPANKSRFVMDAQGRSYWSATGEVPGGAVAAAPEAKQGKSAKKGGKAAGKDVTQEKRMISLPKHIQSILQAAAQKAMPELNEDLSVVPQKNELWDYQSPSAMQLFNKHKKTGSFGFPTCKALAEAILNNVASEEYESTIDKIELSKIGKGPDEKSGFFLNIYLKDNFVQDRINLIASEKKQLEMSNLENKQGKNYTVLVDFSSPNIAKNMHVGHLRSTIQGDSICRIFEYLGYKVHRVNHVGDWGTQFGMLIQELSENFPDFLTNTPNIADLQTFYQNSKKRFDTDPEFKAKAHQNVVKLQSGDEYCLAGWKLLCDCSRKEFQQLYDRMDIRLEEVGESFYNPLLKPLIAELQKTGHIVESDGAQVIKVGKKNSPPMIVQKSDGGFGYASTDLAALRHRLHTVKADRVVIVTDVSQELHFKQLFEAGQKVGFYDPKMHQMDHMMFGMVQQESEELDEKTGKMVKKITKIKTREGKSVKLVELLDEARDRALKSFAERKAMMAEKDENATAKVQIEGEEEMKKAAEILGLSSIKYFDLKQNRTQNYVFDFDNMLRPDGNTGVYLIYAYVRICGILRKAGFDEDKDEAGLGKFQFTLSNKSERDLALTLLRLPEQLEAAAKDLMVNRLTDQLYDISQRIGDFYVNSKVIGSEEQNSRIALLVTTKKVMEVCFNLLGMKTIKRI